MQAARVLKRAVENQVKGLGFSFVEVLSPCPTIWKMQPLEAQTFVREEMAAVFPVSNLAHGGRRFADPARSPGEVEDLPRMLGLTCDSDAPDPRPPPRRSTPASRSPASAGQGVLMLGEVLAEAGLEAGYEVSWLPSYGPEMRSGTSNCHVRLSNSPDRFAAGHPAQRAARDERAVPAQVSPGCRARRHRPLQWRGGPGRLRPPRRARPRPAVHGNRRRARRVEGGEYRHARRAAGNDGAARSGAGRRRPATPRQESQWFDLDVAALERGRDAVRSDDDYLWGVYGTERPRACNL